MNFYRFPSSLDSPPPLPYPQSIKKSSIRKKKPQTRIPIKINIQHTTATTVKSLINPLLSQKPTLHIPILPQQPPRLTHFELAVFIFVACCSSGDSQVRSTIASITRDRSFRRVWMRIGVMSLRAFCSGV